MKNSALVASIATAIFMAYVAWSQWKVNKYKLRLDLYDRRFAIYEKVIVYYKAHVLSINERPADIDFVCAFRSSAFLFGKESNVYLTLLKIKDELAKTNTDYSIVSNLMDELDFELVPWLDFRTIESG